MSGGQALEGFYAALADDDAAQLYERAPCGYLSTTPDGRIVKVNQTFLTLSGFTQDDLVGKRTFADLLTPGGRIYHETHYVPMLMMQGQAREIALEMVRADGRRLAVLVNSVLERAADGTPTVVRTAVFDATERRRYERELVLAKQRAEESEERATTLARTLQQTLIPPEPPVVEGLDLAARYRPAGDGREVGGDFYDIFQVGPDDWVLAIGDVCGKGVEAAVVTSLARYTLRGACVPDAQPAHALGVLNQALLDHGSDRYCTVALLRLRFRDGAWLATLSCGGHPLPLLVRPGGRPRAVARPGMLLGIMSGAAVSETEVVLAPGEAILLFTDGVTEGRRGSEPFGNRRLEASAGRHAGSAAGLCEGVLGDVMDFQSGVPRDDIALLAVMVPPRSSTRATGEQV